MAGAPAWTGLLRLGVRIVPAEEARLGRALPLLNENRLREVGKGATEKVVLAWWLRQSATVSLRWVSERLRMGHYSRVTQAVSRVARRPGGKHKKMKKQLIELTRQWGANEKMS